MQIDDDTAKYGILTLIGVISGAFTWLSKRQINRIDEVEKKVIYLEKTTVHQDKIESQFREIRQLVADSRKEFREEHHQTRKELKDDIQQMRDNIIQLINAKMK